MIQSTICRFGHLNVSTVLCYLSGDFIKFMFSEKATKIDEIFTIDLTVTTYCQINGEYCVNFCGLLRKLELYLFSCML